MGNCPCKKRKPDEENLVAEIVAERLKLENQRFRQRAQLKFPNSFYGQDSWNTDRDEMRMDRLVIKNKKWIKKNLKMEELSLLERGLIKWTVKDEGNYEFHLESRSTHFYFSETGPAMGVNIKLKMNLKENDVLYFFIADTVFLFDEKKNLIAVPGAAGAKGEPLSDGSLNQHLQNCAIFRLEMRGRENEFNQAIEESFRGYDPKSVLNGENRKWSDAGSGYRNGYKYLFRAQGGSSYVNPNYESEIQQNTLIPDQDHLDPLERFTVPFIEIKLLK